MQSFKLTVIRTDLTEEVTEFQATDMYDAFGSVNSRVSDFSSIRSIAIDALELVS